MRVAALLLLGMAGSLGEVQLGGLVGSFEPDCLPYGGFAPRQWGPVQSLAEKLQRKEFEHANNI